MPGIGPAPLGEPLDDRHAKAFAALHQRFFVMPNPWDAGTAKFLARAGFAALASSSAALAWSLGRPDGTLRREEAIEHAAMLGAASGLPINGDFEDGYGATPGEVGQTIRQAIEAGISGASIEDLARDRGEPLLSLAVARNRVEAARETIDRMGSSFVLTARCEAFLVKAANPLEVVLERLAAYCEAGADVLYAPGLTRAEEVAAVVAETNRPVNVLAGLGGVSDDLPTLEALGVRRISLGSNLARTALSAFSRSIDALAQGRVEVDRSGPNPTVVLAQGS